MPHRIAKTIVHHLDPRKHYFFSSTNWLLMAFISGAVNAGGYLACHRFVTHVTGFATLFGIDAVNRNYNEAVGIASVPIFFILGAMISAYFMERPILMHKKSRYYVVSALISSCLLLCALGGYVGWFGSFGEPLLLSRDYVLLCLLVLAAGMQNSAVTSASSATVRTSHLTGVSTDIGIGLIRAATMKQHHSDDYFRESFLLWTRIGIVAFFILGSVAGVLAFFEYGYLGFLLPGLLSMVESFVSWKYRHLFESRHAWLRLEPFHKNKPA